MIWESIVRSGVIAPDFSRWSAMSGFVGKTAEKALDFAGILYNLVRDLRDCDRPELHFIRGPGPK